MVKVSKLTDKKEIFKLLVDSHITDAKHVSSVYNSIKLIIDNKLYSMSI
jgi:hypothetical protein